ncbi:MAG: hypothetical protein H0X33_14170 [Taibaiella sp.]|nr:hypothetical protein [Taibaiella sp.]
MIEYQFFLDDLEVDEPEGFDSIELSISRGDMHGIGFEASTSTLKFHGPAALYIQNLNETLGLKAKVIFTANTRCIGPYAEWDELMTGRLNFGKLKMNCGTECSATIPVERDSCELVLNSRYDQQVDVDAFVGVDKITALQQYNEMGNFIELLAQELFVGLEANVEDGGFNVSQTFVGGSVRVLIRPDLAVQTLNSVDTGYPIATLSYQRENDIVPSTITPMLVPSDTSSIKCFGGGFDYNVRFKGTYQVKSATPLPRLILGQIVLRIVSWDETTGNIFSNGTTVASAEIKDASPVDLTTTYLNGTFDVTLTGNYVIPVGRSLFAYLEFHFISFTSQPDYANVAAVIVNFQKQTHVNITGTKICPPTSCQYYMVHETLSHVTEEITNGCLKVKSSYYGRINSQPYSFSVDGCGGLRLLTSGLKIRNAPTANFFASLKQLMDGLNAIDNIGFGVIGSDLVIEPVRYFYKDKEVARCPYIPDVAKEIDENGHYAKVTAGYSNWKVGRINGLDEFNSEREYKTSFETISSTLNIQSELVTGGYPIEVTRQQTFADTGAADTTYDNNIFLICVKHAPSPYTTFDVEQGGIDNPANMFSPGTVYNWRLRPVANMLRWFKTIAAGYRNISETANKVFFSSGTGNILASGIESDTVCRPENFPTQENQDIFYNQTNDFMPIWRNENVTYDYPMSIQEYNHIKDDPYGYVSFQCGNGTWDKGYIKDLRFRPNKGMATYILKRAY